MVDYIEATRILNQSVLDVINSAVLVDTFYVETYNPMVRVQESVTNVAYRAERIAPVTKAFNLSQYKNKFYSIYIEEQDKNPLDYFLEQNTSFIGNIGGSLAET